LRHRRSIAALGTAALAGVGLMQLVPPTGAATNATAAKTTRARGVIRAPDGKVIGSIRLTQKGKKVKVEVRAKGLQPGFHGLHLHAIGSCQGPTFMSAGGHVGPNTHGQHPGDLPSLLANSDGTARLVAESDHFSIHGIKDADSSALIIHAGRDNFANIPPRYAPGGPDQMTLDTGDSGRRVGCAAIR
jgi:superoxide dismutase, Cu-Zn family